MLARAINKCFQKYFWNVKAYYKQPNEHLLKVKIKVNLKAKLSKITLKNIDKSVSLAVMKNYDKSRVIQVSQVFGTL